MNDLSIFSRVTGKVTGKVFNALRLE